jgi:hypothetical protein
MIVRHANPRLIVIVLYSAHTLVIVTNLVRDSAIVEFYSGVKDAVNFGIIRVVAGSQTIWRDRAVAVQAEAKVSSSSV